MYQLEGSIKLISEPQTFQSGFTKREFVVTTDEQYPQDIKFECVKEKCALLDGLAPNQQVQVSFRIRGNEYQGRYFVNLQAFKIDSSSSAGGGGASTSSVGGASRRGGTPEEPPGVGSSGDGVDDDPFADERSPF